MWVLHDIKKLDPRCIEYRHVERTHSLVSPLLASGVNPDYGFICAGDMIAKRLAKSSKGGPDPSFAKLSKDISKLREDFEGKHRELASTIREQQGMMTALLQKLDKMTITAKEA